MRETVLLLLMLSGIGCTNSVAPEGSPAAKVEGFVLRMEQKYNREAHRNAIDLHFIASGESHMIVRVTYDQTADSTTANSIADAAVELARRLKREDSTLNGVDITIEREVKARD